MICNRDIVGAITASAAAAGVVHVAYCERPPALFAVDSIFLFTAWTHALVSATELLQVCVIGSAANSVAADYASWHKVQVFKQVRSCWGGRTSKRLITSDY